MAGHRWPRVCCALLKRYGWSGSATRAAALLVLVTDGRATYGPNAVSRSRLVADHLRRAGVASLVIDCESGRLALGLAQTLSIHLGAQYLTVGEVGADQLVHAVRQGRAA